jgi:hypothetical protein
MKTRHLVFGALGVGIAAVCWKLRSQGAGQHHVGANVIERRKHEQARRAKYHLLSIFSGQPWLRGIGITGTDIVLPDGRYDWTMPRNGETRAPFVDAVAFNVRDEADISLARDLVGDSVLGVPIVYKAVGDIVAFAGADASVTATNLPLPGDEQRGIDEAVSERWRAHAGKSFRRPWHVEIDPRTGEWLSASNFFAVPGPDSPFWKSSLPEMLGYRQRQQW